MVLGVEGRGKEKWVGKVAKKRVLGKRKEERLRKEERDLGKAVKGRRLGLRVLAVGG